MSNPPDAAQTPDAQPPAFTVRLNGAPVETSTGVLIDLLRERGVRLEVIAAEVNGEVVPREQMATHRLHPGDTIEVVTLVGGG